MLRIFKYCDILNITPDKELNILVYRSPSYLIIYRNHTLFKMVRFFGPPCIFLLRSKCKLTTRTEQITSCSKAVRYFTCQSKIVTQRVAWNDYDS